MRRGLSPGLLLLPSRGGALAIAGVLPSLPSTWSRNAKSPRRCPPFALLLPHTGPTARCRAGTSPILALASLQRPAQADRRQGKAHPGRCRVTDSTSWRCPTAVWGCSPSPELPMGQEPPARCRRGCGSRSRPSGTLLTVYFPRSRLAEAQRRGAAVPAEATLLPRSNEAILKVIYFFQTCRVVGFIFSPSSVSFNQCAL